MIESRKDYLSYLEKDRLALAPLRKRPKLFGDEVWKFQRLLRKLEVVNKSFTEPNINIAGVPAGKISAKGSEGLI